MIAALLHAAIGARASLIDPRHETAFRLFNGFSEGLSALALDVYAKALVVHDYSDPPDAALTAEALGIVREHLPWITCAVLKPRESKDAAERAGRLLFGNVADLPRRLKENGVSYALNLLLNRDASFYLDTRGVRAWAKEMLTHKRVFNTFSYTGSLSVAARAAAARRVVSTDLSRRFLNQTKDSYTLNGFPIERKDFIEGDFFRVTAGLRRNDELFDCVFLDPPFSSETAAGRVDARDMKQLINRLRPLVAHEGSLVVINNALFVSGKTHMTMLEEICGEGYTTIERTIAVPQDMVGYSSDTPAWPTDPAPFNHPTKIVVLRLSRKDLRQ